MRDSTERIRAAEAFGLLAAAGIGATRLAYEEFYRSIGTTVDEVGLSNWQMLTVSGAVLLAFAPLTFIAIYLGVALARIVNGRPIQVWIGVFVACLVIIGGTSALGTVSGSPVLPVMTALGAAAVVLALARPDIVNRRNQLRLSVNWFLIVAAGTVLLLWSFCLAGAGPSARSLHEDGTRTKGVTFLLDVAVRPVCVRTVATGTSAASGLVPGDRPLLLLGVGGRQIVLRDVRTSKTLFLPPESTLLEYKGDTAC